MKAILFNLCFLLFFINSCNKSPEEIKSTPAIPATPPKTFVPVYLFGAPWAWGGGICSWGWIMVREDTTGITYHATHLPGGITTLPSNPISVKIQYHDTANIMGGCWDDIVVDSVKF
jgi:hypothetical protein